MAEAEKFKTGHGLYAYTSFTAAMFFPPVMALNGRYLGVALYLLLFVAYGMLRRRRFFEAHGLWWFFASVLISVLGLASHYFSLGLGSVLPVIVVMFGVALLVQVVLSILVAYQRDEF